MMRTTHRLLLALALLLMGVLPALLQPPAVIAASGEILDQSQTEQNTSGMVGDPRVGQVFTAGISGTLTRVSLVLANYASSPATGPVTVSIQTVTDDGLPSGRQIGSGQILLSAIPPAGSPSWVDAALISPARMIAGTRYVLIVGTAGGIVRWYQQIGGDSDPYPRGYPVARPVDAWEKIVTNQDWAFKTYTWPQALDQQQTATPNYYDLVGAGQRIGQTVTAGLYGMLHQVSVMLEQYSTSPTSGPVMVEVYRVSGGYPFGLPITSGLIPLDAIPPAGSPTWVDVSLAGTFVTAGSQYVIVLATSDAGHVRWAATSNVGSYPGGSELINYATGGWSTKPYDMAFKTYVLQSVMDQEQISYSAYWGFRAGTRFAQTFTSDVDGVLDSVAMVVSVPAPQPSLPLNISIQTLTSGGAPSGTEVASGMIPVVDVGTGPSWVLGRISPLYAAAGSHYAIVLSTNDEAGNYVLWHVDSWSDPYPGGSSWDSGITGSDWSSFSGWPGSYRDFAFRTYIIPEQLPPMAPGPTTPVSTSTSLTSSANPAPVGAEVTYTATASPAPGGGSVRFQDNGTDLTGCSEQPVDAAGTATCAVTYTRAGTHAITASFSGAAGFTPSYATLSQTIGSPDVFAHPAFEDRWARTDRPVAAEEVDRTWWWGPEPSTSGRQEPYLDAPGDARLVQYFDKSRMELTNPAAPDDGLWYVTNGLLVVEMVEGWYQIGDADFDTTPEPADIPIAGDPDDPFGPTYADINRLGLRSRAALPAGSAITQTLFDGAVGNDDRLAAYGVTAAQRVQVPGIDHTIASVFWEVMTADGTVWDDGALVTDALFTNPYYATGYPITEAYWSRVTVDGVAQDVLWQCFERRCLTWTPDNPDGWQVEAGNVGLHYERWRYGDAEQVEPPTANQQTTWSSVATNPADEIDLHALAAGAAARAVAPRQRGEGGGG